MYALDYRASFPQFGVRLAHYAHYGVTLWMDMRRRHFTDFLSLDNNNRNTQKVCRKMDGKKADENKYIPFLKGN